MTSPICVVADIGGTNTRVSVCRGIELERDTIRRYANSDHDGIEVILRDFLAVTGVKPEAVCVDMAGPVIDGVGRLTNLDWLISSENIAAETGAKTVAVLNDMQAQGFSLNSLGPDSLTEVMRAPKAAEDATKLVVNVGTGLNAAPVYRMNGQTFVPPAESGHITMPVQTDDELELKEWIAERHGTPGIEDVLSGRGFERVYAWHCMRDGAGEPLRAAEIMEAHAEGDERAARTMELFVRMMGRYAGNLALISLPFGGVYLVGGVVRHFGPFLHDMGFNEAFRDKGRFGPFMEQFPVYLVDDDYAALTGCATHLQELLTT